MDISTPTNASAILPRNNDQFDELDLPQSTREEPARYAKPSPALVPVVLERVERDLPIAAKNAVAYLADALFDNFIRPSLTTTVTRDGYIKFWTERFLEFRAGLDAFYFFLKQDDGAAGDLPALTQVAMRTGGESGAREVDFAAKTFERAGRLVGRFPGLPRPVAADEDRKIAARYRTACLIHNIGVASLYAVDANVRPGSPEVLQAVFEFVRQGGLDAYVHARAAYDIRRVPTAPAALIAAGVVFDDEDTSLAASSGDDAEATLRLAE